MPFRPRLLIKIGWMAFGITTFACLILFWNIPPGHADQPIPETGSSTRQPLKQRVLVLNAYYKGDPRADGIMDGIESVFKSSTGLIAIHAEYLDIERHRSGIIFPILKQLYAAEYPHRKLDAVIAAGQEALDFVLTYRDALFENVPVVFCGIDHLEERLLYGSEGITGIVETVDLAGTVELALNRHPSTRRILAIHDTGSAGVASAVELGRIAMGLKKDVHLDYLADPTVGGLGDALTQLAPDTLVLLLHFMHDREGTFLPAAGTRRLVAEASRVPVYTPAEMYVGDGVMGGMIVRSRDQGLAAAQMTQRILNGDPVRDIPVVRATPSIAVFDFRAMKRFGVKLSRLPRGSEVINRPPGFFESHKSGLIVAALIALLLLIIASQALNSFRIRKAEAVLRRSEERYRYIFETTAVAIREEDYTCVKSMIDTEKARGVGDFGNFLDQHPEFVSRAADAVQVTDVNQAAIRLYEGSGQRRLLGPLSMCFFPESYMAFKQVLAAIAEGRERIEFELSASTCQGRTLHLLISIRIPRTPDNFRRVLVCINDITRIKEAEAKLENYRSHLEDLVRERTADLDQAVAALQSSLRQVGETQAQLVRSEKMAALGGLVAGVAHEINTPIGIGVTAISFLQDEAERLRRRCAGSIPESRETDAFMETVTEISTTVLASLKRAADLVHSFKQVAVDQTVEERRTINLGKYINEILLTLIPKYKKTAHTITVHCPPDIELETYPGAISQIVTNLVMNSLTHGFDGIPKGDILLTISENDGGISLQYSDNGRGMDQTTLARAFEHFFTTNRKHGSTGLGLNIVHNLVTGKLGGTIECLSEPGKGAVFTIQLPESDAADPARDAAKAGSRRESGGILHA